MKIIHTADLHLDSSMKTNLDSAKAKERKNELTLNFGRLVDYAAKNNVSAILIAGDLFDTKSISKTVARAVYNNIISNPDISFCYLKGNHDKDSFIHFVLEAGETPNNLYTFDNEWSKYVLSSKEGLKSVCLYGAETTEGNVANLVSRLNTVPEDINIVMLHGQESEYYSKDAEDVIPIGELKGRFIDYLALGHVHEMKIKTLDSRGTYAYPGCLEGRGFDECGNHGFLLLDIDEKTGDIIPEFIDFAYRKFYTIQVDVSDISCSEDASLIVKTRIKEANPGYRDLVKIVLTGNVDENAEIDSEYICTSVTDEFYYVKVKDCTKVAVDYRKYAADESLKGWFIRLVEADNDLDEETKGEIVRLGIDALAGEEV